MSRLTLGKSLVTRRPGHPKLTADAPNNAPNIDCSQAIRGAYHLEKISENRPRSIYQYSSMAPRLWGLKLQIFQVSFVPQFPKETRIQRKQHQM